MKDVPILVLPTGHSLLEDGHYGNHGYHHGNYGNNNWSPRKSRAALTTASPLHYLSLWEESAALAQVTN